MQLMGFSIFQCGIGDWLAVEIKSVCPWWELNFYTSFISTGSKSHLHGGTKIIRGSICGKRFNFILFEPSTWHLNCPPNLIALCKRLTLMMIITMCYYINCKCHVILIMKISMLIKLQNTPANNLVAIHFIKYAVPDKHYIVCYWNTDKLCAFRNLLGSWNLIRER